MRTSRLEAFSDGVVAILITIMVLELKIPHGSQLSDLKPLWPVFLAYVLSFVVIAIYWNNHHHMIHATKHVDGATLWANIHLLFWLSLIPFTTAWMGENHFATVPTSLYGVTLLASALAYTTLQATIIRHGAMSPEVVKSLSGDVKGKVSTLLYASAIPLAFVHPAISGAIYAGVALWWLIPDRRIERVITPED